MKKLSFLCVAALLFASCASEDNANQSNKSQQDTTNVPMVTFAGYQPVTTSQTRTTATHERGKAAKVFWESTDRIWVKARDGQFHQSNAAQFHAVIPPATINKAKANFTLAMGDYGFNPKVHYTGASGRADRVTIAAIQTQTQPNDFSHLGRDGDCGSAVAIGGGGDFEFTLNHKASYLCFVPRCMNTALGPNIKLVKIVVRANKDIAGEYDFSDGVLVGKIPTSGSNTITLNTNGNFSLNTTTSNIAMNGAYMVIAPGKYDLSISYTLQDVNGKTGDIVKEERNFICSEGSIRDITANLTPIEFDKYFMWDAQQNYWWENESGQSFVNNTQGTGWPISKTADPQRWYNDGGIGFTGSPARFDAQSTSFRSLPNINEMWWYCMKGDPHWVNPKPLLFVQNGHLQIASIGGLWLRKKRAIIAYLKANEGYPASFTEDDLKNGYKSSYGASPVDYRSVFATYTQTTPTIGTPANINDYFFIPALGYYYLGYLYRLGTDGYYWSTSANTEMNGFANSLDFNSSRVGVFGNNRRNYGFQKNNFQ